MRQQHGKDGSVTLTFSAVVESPDLSQSGTLAIAAVDNATWSKTTVVAVPDAGRNIIPVEVKHLLQLSNTVPTGWLEVTSEICIPGCKAVFSHSVSGHGHTMVHGLHAMSWC